MIKIVESENLAYLKTLPDASVDLIYIDPPFNTGREQRKTQYRVKRDETGTRTGFQGFTYIDEIVSEKAYPDTFDNYLEFIYPRLLEAYRLLKSDGSFYFHIDYREVHYCKVLLDGIFGRDSFLNEIIWAYDYGGRTKKKWPAKHDNILYYVKNPAKYTFNRDDVDRLEYMAPGLVSAEKRKRGKFPTDTWWHTIVPTNGPEKTGYPTQKPIGIVRRMILASSNPGDLVLDFFAGSGTTGVVCAELGRDCILVDENPEAIAVMRKRLPDAVFVGQDDRGGEMPEKSMCGDSGTNLQDE